MRIQRSRAAVFAVAAVIVAGVIAASVAFASGGSSAASAHGRGAGQEGNRHHGRDAFAWFRAQPGPASWRQAALPGGNAVLSYPPSLSRLGGDKGTVSEGLISAGKVLVYLNSTPRQGNETLSGWTNFRLQHLREDDARSARLVGSATGLAFRGGQGSCVIDTYLSKVHANPYQEIACYVQGTRSSSVVIAATAAADWARYGGLLEQAVSSYAVK
jgi:hypothetical protein